MRRRKKKLRGRERKKYDQKPSLCLTREVDTRCPLKEIYHTSSTNPLVCAMLHSSSSYGNSAYTGCKLTVLTFAVHFSSPSAGAWRSLSEGLYCSKLLPQYNKDK